MTDIKTYSWTALDVRKAQAIWQREIADHHDDDPPQGARRRAFRIIAAELKRTVDAVAARHHQFGASFTAGPRAGAASREALVARAERVAAALQRDLTASVFGDPPPGFSALDRRRAGQRGLR